MADERPVRTHLAAAPLGAAFFAASLLVLTREILVLAQGAENAATAALAAAMTWAALGALFGSRLVPRLGPGFSAGLLGLLPALFALEFWAARTQMVQVLSLSGGVAVPWSLALAAALLTAPSSVVAGMLLPLSARGVAPERIWPSTCAAAAAGGAGVALATALDCSQACTTAAICGVFACLVSATVGPRLLRRGKFALAAWTLLVAAAASAAALTPFGRSWTRRSADRAGLVGRAGARPAAEVESACGNLVVLRGEGEAISVFRNGVLVAGHPDPAARDDAIFACSQAKVLGRVLVVGSGRPALVRELLLRGAYEVDVFEPDPGLREQLESFLPEDQREALRSKQVRLLHGGLDALPGRSGSRYDLLILSTLPASSAGNSRAYSAEFLRSLALRLSRRSVLVVTAPGAGKKFPEHLGRLYASLRETGGTRTLDGSRLLGLPAAFPSGRIRFAAPRGMKLCLSAQDAGRRYYGHRGPKGGNPAPVEDRDFHRLVNPAAVQKLTQALSSAWDKGEILRESAVTPRIWIDHLLERMRARSPRSAHLLDAVLAMRWWIPFPVLLAAFLVGGLVARRARGPMPGQFMLFACSAGTGLAVVGALGAANITYAVQSGALYGALPLLWAAFAGGTALGASLAGRLERRMKRSPRRALACIHFGMMLILFLGWQVANLPAGTIWTDLTHGLGLALLGLTAGLELGSLSICWSTKVEAHQGTAALAGATGVGALTAGALGVLLVLPVMGPPSAFLLLLAVKVVTAGMLAAGAGRRRAGGGSSTSLPKPVPSVPPLPR